MTTVLKTQFKKETVFCLSFVFAGALVFLKLASRRSSEPFLFGWYSLPYVVFLVLFAGTILFLGFLFYRTKLRALPLLFVNALVFLACLIPIELAGQTYAYFRPSYKALIYAPDPVVGWKFFPNREWTWAGLDWYARDFSVRVWANSHGFRDAPREFQKPPRTLRVALLGDSFVEALQVPFEKTAGHLLEQKLNTSASRTMNYPGRYEVLNFGVSCHSLGQTLLTWEAYASKFSPDYVFLFVGERQVERVVDPNEVGNFPATQKRQLWVRPTFGLKDGQLIREPARDFETFHKTQREVLETEFGGRGFVKRRRGLFLGTYFRQLPPLGKNWFWDPLMAIQRNLLTPGKGSGDRAKLAVKYFDPELIQINLNVLETLERQIKGTGAQFALVDASSYLNPQATALSEALRKSSAELGWNYIPFSDDLWEANRKGVSPQWKHDGHFNEAGHELFAQAMYRWMVKEGEGDKAHVEV